MLIALQNIVASLNAQLHLHTRCYGTTLFHQCFPSHVKLLLNIVDQI